MDGHHHHRCRRHRPDILPLPSAAPPLGYAPTLHSYLFSNNPPHEHYFSRSSSSFVPKDAWSTKLARTKRKLARQRTLSLTKSAPSSSSSSGFRNCSSDEYSKPTTITHYPNTESQSKGTNNLFTFYTPDNKILRMLLRKELKNSDVGSLGRIVLPKREAEENLPLLTDKEGIQIEIRDVNSNRKWAMKYKYWANNRSRMYVLENTGDFVRQNGLSMGDVMTLYQDECKNLYVSVEKEDNESSMEENDEEMKNSYTNTNMDILKQHKQQQHHHDHHELSLALFNEQPSSYNSNNNNNNINININNNLVVSQNTDNYNYSSYFERYWSSAYNYMNNNNNTRRPAATKGNYNNNNNINNGKELVDQDLNAINNDFEDCFEGLDTLPEVSGLFKFHQIT